jgi:hypothetical protein
LLIAEDQGMRLTLRRAKIPAGQGEVYRQDWEEYYFQPMLEYFGA